MAVDSTSDSSTWIALRERVLTALDEDPANEARLVRRLDRRPPDGFGFHQHVLSTLIGSSPRESEARELLQAALDVCCRPDPGDDGRRRPLRLVLLEQMLQENRRRAAPLAVEIRSGPAPAVESLADPARGATAPEVLLSQLQAELRRARRFEHPVAVLRLRLDGWDELHWTGAPEAERLLGVAALRVKNAIRDVDWAARTVDSDLLVVLNGTGRLGALLVVRRIAARLAEIAPGPTSQTPSVSTGVAVFPDDAPFAPDLLEMSRRALLRARSRGGGGVCAEARSEGRDLVPVPAKRVRVALRRLPGDAAPEIGTDGDRRLPEGLLFHSPVPYEVGTLVEMDCIEVAGVGQARLRGRIVRLEERPGDGYEIGVACRLDEVRGTLLRDATSG